MAYPHITIATLYALAEAARSGKPASQDDILAMARSEPGELSGGLVKTIKAIARVGENRELSKEIAEAAEAGDGNGLSKLYAKAGLRNLDTEELRRLSKAGKFFADNTDAWPSLLGAISLGDRETLVQIVEQAGLPSKLVELLNERNQLGNHSLGGILVDGAISW